MKSYIALVRNEGIRLKSFLSSRSFMDVMSHMLQKVAKILLVLLNLFKLNFLHFQDCCALWSPSELLKLPSSRLCLWHKFWTSSPHLAAFTHFHHPPPECFICPSSHKSHLLAFAVSPVQPNKLLPSSTHQDKDLLSTLNKIISHFFHRTQSPLIVVFLIPAFQVLPDQPESNYSL